MACAAKCAGDDQGISAVWVAAETMGLLPVVGFAAGIYVHPRLSFELAYRRMLER